MQKLSLKACLARVEGEDSLKQIQEVRSRSNGNTYLLRIPNSDPIASVVMLHGLGGNAHSMWVLEAALPKETAIVSPRGSFDLGDESYSWVKTSLMGWPTMEDFKPSIQSLQLLIEELQEDGVLADEKLFLLGFSQGAALAFAAASFLKPAAVIAAAGFLPRGDLSALQGIPIFWGHGSEDRWVPITTAKEGVQRLVEIGARVDFCEAQVGHKLGLECFQGLKKWLSRQLNGN
jgi:phospholipase/carboxylesterase